MGIILLYVLPFILTLLLLPKCSAANSGERRSNWNNPVRVRNILLAIFIGSIPFVNYCAVFLCLWIYTSEYVEVFSADVFDLTLADIFSRKKKE